MKINDTHILHDGGTVELQTTVGKFYIDNRIGSSTIGFIFDKYPSMPDAVNISRKNPRLAKRINEVVDKLKVTVREIKIEDSIFDLNMDNFACPLEKQLAESLLSAGIKFERPSSQRLDFYLPDYDIYIEVKRYHADRVLSQLASQHNIILVQGVKSINALCDLLSKLKPQQP